MGPRAFLSAVLVVATAGGSSAAELRIDVDGHRSTEGRTYVSVWKDPDGFPTRAGAFDGTKVSVGDAAVLDLPPGRWAIAVFHDENGNGEFDQNFFGVPLEGWGFANDAMGFMSAPSFDAAAIDLPASGTVARITLRY